MAKISLEDALARHRFSFWYEDYKVIVPCRFKADGTWKDAKFDVDNKVIYSLDGEIIRRLQYE